MTAKKAAASDETPAEDEVAEEEVVLDETTDVDALAESVEIDESVDNAFLAACYALVIPPGDPQYVTVDLPDYGPLTVRITPAL